MQIISPAGWLLFIMDAICLGFSVFTVLLLIMRVISRNRFREEVINIQSAVNLTLAIGIVLEVINYGYIYYEEFASSADYERYAFFNSVINEKVFIASIILFWVIGLLFFIRKFRKSWVLSLLALLLANLGFIMEWVYKFWKDYEPSGWETDYESQSSVLQLLVFAGLVFLFYLLLAKRKKLPYASTWI